MKNQNLKTNPQFYLASDATPKPENIIFHNFAQWLLRKCGRTKKKKKKETLVLDSICGNPYLVPKLVN
jgi:hypothetical protein